MVLALDIARVEGARDKIKEFEKERMERLGLSPSQYTLQELLELSLNYSRNLEIQYKNR